MPIAQDMKSLADKIVGDYETRISVLGNLISDTHGTLKDARGMIKGFSRERSTMAAQLKKDLGSFVSNLVDTTGSLLKGFSQEHKKMAAVQAKDLAQFAADLESTVKKMLKDFEKSHAEMSEQMKDDLDKFVKSIVHKVKDLAKETKGMMGDFHKDIAAAASAWQNMAGNMTKARHGVALRIGKGKSLVGVEVKTAEEAAKPHKKGKRGRPRKS